MSIVRSNGTLVKSDFTSNGTISYPAGMGSSFICRMKSFVLLMSCSDSLNGDSTLGASKGASIGASLTDMWLC